jgi:predicted dinucleotide-binding enzyme
MRIGILGSGLMGGKLGTIFARAGHDVVFSYAHSERKLKRLAREAQGSARTGTPGDAARGADALLLAVHWSRVGDVLKQAGEVPDKVIVSCSLPMNAERHRPRHRPHVLGRGDARKEVSAGSRRFRVRHGAERGVVQRLRGEAQGQPAELALLR